MRGLQWVLASLVVVLSAMSASTVSAQALRGVRLRVDPTLFDYLRQTGGREADGTASDKVSTQTFGLFPSSLWIGVGVSPNNNFNFGATTLLGTTADNAYRGTSQADRWLMLVPYAEYVSNGRELRGFIGAHAGIGAFVRGVGAKGVFGAFGASFGLRYFMDEHVSFDPHLRVLYTAMPTAQDVVQTLSVGIVLGFSFWLGSSKAPAPQQTAHHHRPRHADATRHEPPRAPDQPAPADAPPASTAPTTTPSVTPAPTSTAPATTPTAPATAAPPSPATP